MTVTGERRRFGIIRRRWVAAVATAVMAAALGGAVPGWVVAQEPLDPVYNLALPCEAVGTPGLVPRSARNIAHLANVCGFVGTDIEFQSRTDASGAVRDYAFVGTMGAGTRIFDITDPAHPTFAGGYLDPGWQNDVQVRGDTLVVGFDWLVVGANVSTCLREKSPTNGNLRGGVDIVRLLYNPETATFTTVLVDCFLSTIGSGGAHTVTVHPSGQWLAQNTAFAGIEVVDLRSATPTLVRRIPTSVVDAAHDVFFSADGNTLYSAGVDSTRIVDVTDIFNRAPTLISVVPNAPSAAQGGDGQTVDISHQSDTTVDGALLLVTDEAGGGLLETSCHEGPNTKIGGLHTWALQPVEGAPGSADATPASPMKIGTWLYPNPGLAVDALGPALALLGRTERACTIHVYRVGGNGSASPGPIEAGFDGVSSIGDREMVSAHYGAGVWHLDVSGPSRSDDGVAEEPRSTWGNTLGWNVMPGADTWSAKEYKGHIFAGDINRGFDVYAFKPCEGANCIVVPVSTPGRATGGGQTTGELAELAIVSGTSAGGKATFGFNAQLESGATTPTGDLTFHDHAAGKKVKMTAIQTYTQSGNLARFTGLATVNGVPGVTLFVEVQDFGEPGAGGTSPDTFRIVLGDGYGAGGALLKGNIQVHG